MSETKLGTAMNAFAPTGEIKGRLDLQANIDSLSCIIDSTQNTAIKAGTPVKVVTTSAKLPHIVACASGDLIMGFVKHSPRKDSFVAGDVVEVSYGGDVMYLEADSAINAGVPVNVTDFTDMAVGPIGSTAGSTVGFALEKATSAGQLVRVLLRTPVQHVANADA